MTECCSGEVKLLYSCSGTADVGELADRVTRRLRDKGLARMSCLAAIGANLSGYIESAKGADENIAISGCSTRCAQKCLERIGVAAVSYVLTEKFALEKGKTQVTDALVEEISRKLKNEYDAERASMKMAMQGGCACSGSR